MWWAPRAPKNARPRRCDTGSFRPTKKLRKVDVAASPVKRLRVLHLPGACRLYCITPLAGTMFQQPRITAEVVLFTVGFVTLSQGAMNESERLSRLRHDLSNPLSALLAETQLLLLNESQIDAETLQALREIEALAIRMRTMLREI
jgi:signal transduction histidine kinase